MKYIFMYVTDMQHKLEQEQQQRKVTEERLLNVEKEKSGYSVDLQQLRNQVQNLQSELRNEGEKVSKYNLTFLSNYVKLNTVNTFQKCLNLIVSTCSFYYLIRFEEKVKLL